MTESNKPSPADREEDLVIADGNDEPKGETSSVKRLKDEHKNDDGK